MYALGFESGGGADACVKVTCSNSAAAAKKKTLDLANDIVCDDDRDQEEVVEVAIRRW